jgi:hypothetical protein
MNAAIRFQLSRLGSRPAWKTTLAARKSDQPNGLAMATCQRRAIFPAC